MSRKNWFIAIVLGVLTVTCVVVSGQETQTKQNSPLGPLPNEPEKVFAIAAPLYDFSSPELKPWHLKLTYQVYGEKGQAKEPGCYEYWWALHDTHRSTWKRGAAEYTEWKVLGKNTYLQTGDRPQFFEQEIQSALFAALPQPDDLNPKKMRYERELLKMGEARLPCIMLVPRMEEGNMKKLPLGVFPTYCFDESRPVLRAYFSYGGQTVYYEHIGRTQGLILPTEFSIYDGTRLAVKAKVVSVDGIGETAPELMPNASASVVSPPVKVKPEIQQGKVIKQVRPEYPPGLAGEKISGTVSMQVTIGIDGRVHQMHGVEAPDPTLAMAAMKAVAQWEYTPYLLDGKPIEVETTIRVVFNIR